MRGALTEEPWRLERIHHVLEGVLDDEDLVEDASRPAGLQRMPPSYGDRRLWLLQRSPVVYGYASDLPDEDSGVSNEAPPPYRRRPLDLLQRLATIDFPTAEGG